MRSKLFSQAVLSFLVLFLCSACANRLGEKFPVVNPAGAKAPPIHYIEVGQGSPVILIPGLFGIHSVWNRMIPFLSHKYRLLAIDNFGTGASGRPIHDFGYSVAEQADMIVAMMDELKIKSCDLVGVSYGGMIALNIAARYPERVGAIACIEGAVLMPDNSPYLMLERGLEYPLLGEVIIGIIRSGLFDETMAKDIMGQAWFGLKAEEKAEITDIISKNAKAASRRSWHGLARALNQAKDFGEDAKSIRSPVLYLSGDKSSFFEMTKMNIAFFQRNLPNVKMVAFNDGIHDLELQKPQETAALILDFMEKNAPRPQVTASNSGQF